MAPTAGVVQPPRPSFGDRCSSFGGVSAAAFDDDYKAGKVPNRSPGVSSGKGWDDGSEIVLEVDWVRVYENQS